MLKNFSIPTNGIKINNSNFTKMAKILNVIFILMKVL